MQRPRARPCVCVYVVWSLCSTYSTPSGSTPGNMAWTPGGPSGPRPMLCTPKLSSRSKKSTNSARPLSSPAHRFRLFPHLLPAPQLQDYLFVALLHCPRGPLRSSPAACGLFLPPPARLPVPHTARELLLTVSAQQRAQFPRTLHTKARFASARVKRYALSHFHARLYARPPRGEC